MPTITALKPQKKKKGWFSVFLDGQFAFSLSLDTVVAQSLKKGLEISSEAVQNLVTEGELSGAMERALKFLSYRPRSRQEIVNYFKKKEIGAETQKAVFAKLDHLGLIDDEAFARWWVGQRTTFRPRGQYVIKRELLGKGVAREIVEKALGERGGQEEELAQKLLLKKLPRLKDLPPLELRKKLYELLGRRGFSFEIIEKVVAKALGKG